MTLRCPLRKLPFLLAMCSLALQSFAAITVNISPRRAPLTLKQRQQFKATVSGTTGTGITWLVDGIVGGNSTVGTVSTAGLYTPPSTVGTHTVIARSKANTSVSAKATVWVTNYPGMMTYHGETFRSGLNPQERALAPSRMNITTFKKLFTRSVDGQIYAQPLYVANLLIGTSYHNVAYVATEHDSVYAFDADGKTTSPIWKRNFLGTNISTVPRPGNELLSPEIGITGTPVIDPSGKSLFVVATTVESGVVKHKLHALSLTTGAEKYGGPVTISGGYGGVPFAASRHLQRPALLLVNGNVIVCFGSHEDRLPYQGWIFAYNASGGTLHRTGVLSTAPSSTGRAAIWNSGGGPAADTHGNIFVVTGNGNFDLNTAGASAGNSFLKLTLSNGSFHILDFYTPSNYAALNADDLDLGSGGPMIAPTQSGAAVPSLILCGGKDGIIYVVNRSNMGHYSATTDHAVQKLAIGLPEPINGNFFTPANWNGYVYFGGMNEPVMAFKFANGLLPSSPSSQTMRVFGYPGPSATVSANGSSNGIVWVLDNSKFVGGDLQGRVNTAGPAVLHAYRADDLSVELYNSSQAGTRDTAGTAIKFTIPTVANGHVYVGGAKQLTVYGIAP
ncbi:MAG TPA: hypothetical protein VL156_11590 [Terriglobales bacterium]|jgi:hypothetical protein|nr:hypothetical protein [Terriglobales bacterium]